MPRLLWLAAILALATPPASAQTVPMERTGTAFGARLTLRAIGPDWDRLSLGFDAVEAEMTELEVLLDPDHGDLGELNRRGQEPRQVDPRLFDAVQRAQAFCHWSKGRHGPLGGWLYASWGLRQPVAAQPPGDGLQRGIELAGCHNLALDPEGQRIQLTAHARLDLWGFARGFAVDRGIEVLESQGVDNASITLGTVQRATGEGPDGDGWPLRVPLPAQLADQHDKVRLWYESVAAASRQAGHLKMAGMTFPPFLDQTIGRPPEGIVVSLAASELALDALGVAATAFIAGPRLGTHLVAQLRPAPAVLWLLGDGLGQGLLTDYHWSRMLRPPTH